jgi:hypothetical protein
LAVADEVEQGAAIGYAHAGRVRAAGWLGDPREPTAAELKAVFAIHVGLNEGRRPPVDHVGEAESIYFADKLGATFATDDNEAFDFARNRLGAARVLDTVSILRDAVAMGEMRANEAAGIAESIRSAGRHLRRLHPTPAPAAYFDA